MNAADMTTPPATSAEPAKQGFQIQLPTFDLRAARGKAPLVRTAHDPTHDFSQIRDVLHVADFAKQVAVMAAVQITNGATKMQQQYVQHEIKRFAPIVDQAIVEAINRYDAFQRSRAWHRRFLRWIARQPDPFAPQKPASDEIVIDAATLNAPPAPGETPT